MRKLYSLIDKIYRIENLHEAFIKVKKNNGAPGIDGETVACFKENLDANLELLHEELKTNLYKPKPVRKTEIPKADGGVRPLGIPTVRDRVVQQAFVNIVEPYFDRDFHPSSYGYRKGKSQHQAIAKAAMFMREYNLSYVVDMDLSRCFDTLDHELIIKAVADKISDGRVLKLVKLFLESGVMADGVFQETDEGSPQGGVCSPLLANIYLDYFDKKMMNKGVRMVRYADDILIFALNDEQAGNYYTLAKKILEEELKLTVNKEKTHITSMYEGVSFLGFVIKKKYLTIQPKRIKRFKDKIRKITKRNQHTPMELIIKQLNPVIRGWLNYYKIADIKKFCSDFMSWVRRRLRSTRMKQWKTYKKMHKELKKAKLKHNGEKMNVTLWKNSNTHIIHKLLPNSYFSELKLYDMNAQEVGLLSSGKVTW